MLGASADDGVVLQTDDGHPYSGLTLSEWAAANCRLMAFLLSSGQLAPSDADYYLAYTTNIFEYYESYEWENILDFDYLYRERQSEHGFQWGYIPTNMELSLLASPRRKPTLGQGARGKGGALNKQQPASQPKSTEECKLFKNNNGRCPYGEACKYVHPALNQPVTQ